MEVRAHGEGSRERAVWLRVLDEVLAGIGEDRGPVETVGRLGARLILRRALVDEVSEFLGRGRYERSEEPV
jgi:hypothetical protein